MIFFYLLVKFIAMKNSSKEIFKNHLEFKLQKSFKIFRPSFNQYRIHYFCSWLFLMIRLYNYYLRNLYSIIVLLKYYPGVFYDIILIVISYTSFLTSGCLLKHTMGFFRCSNAYLFLPINRSIVIKSNHKNKMLSIKHFKYATRFNQPCYEFGTCILGTRTYSHYLKTSTGSLRSYSVSTTLMNIRYVSSLIYRPLARSSTGSLSYLGVHLFLPSKVFISIRFVNTGKKIAEVAVKALPKNPVEGQNNPIDVTNQNNIPNHPQLNPIDVTQNPSSDTYPPSHYHQSHHDNDPSTSTQPTNMKSSSITENIHTRGSFDLNQSNTNDVSHIKKEPCAISDNKDISSSVKSMNPGAVYFGSPQNSIGAGIAAQANLMAQKEHFNQSQQTTQSPQITETIEPEISPSNDHDPSVNSSRTNNPLPQMPSPNNPSLLMITDGRETSNSSSYNYSSASVDSNQLESSSNPSVDTNQSETSFGDSSHDLFAAVESSVGSVISKAIDKHKMSTSTNTSDNLAVDLEKENHSTITEETSSKSSIKDNNKDQKNPLSKITKEELAEGIKKLKPVQLKNKQGQIYETCITPTTNADDISKEVAYEEGVKRGLFKESKVPGTKIITEDNKEHFVGDEKNALKPTPTGYAYYKKISEQSSVPISSPEIKPMKDFDRKNMFIGAVNKTSDFINSSKQTHMLLMYDENTNTTYALGTLTSKSEGECFMISEKQFKKFQLEQEGKVFTPEEEQKSHNKKPQNFRPFNNAEVIYEQDFHRVKHGTEYLTELNENIFNQLKNNYDDLKNKPHTLFNHQGITKEDSIEMYKEFDKEAAKPKPKFLETDEEKKHKQDAKEKQQEKQKETKQKEQK